MMLSPFQYFLNTLLIFLLVSTPSPNMGSDSEESAYFDRDDEASPMGRSGGEGAGPAVENVVVNASDEQIERMPHRRPWTPYKEGNRKLSPVRIVAGETPCIYKKFLYFFNHAAQLNIHPVELLKSAVISLNETEKKYFYDAEDLCIVVEDDLVVDIYQYDCSSVGVCVCGVYYSFVDPNVPQPEPRKHIRRYVSINGLDRKLVVDDQGECTSGLSGHCTTKDSKALEKLYCSNLLKCVIDDSYGPILRNKVTSETYGVCVPRSKTDDELEKNSGLRLHDVWYAAILVIVNFLTIVI